MKRIMIIGCSGAGKSTLARKIGQKTGLPVIHLDQAYWKANWTETPKTEWEPQVATMALQDKWVIDGNYGSSMDIRFQRADTVIFLDRSTLTCLWRITKRIIHYYGKSRPDMAEACKERFDLEFYHYVATFNLTRRPSILKRLAVLPPSIKVYRINSNLAAKKWLNELALN